MRADFIVLPPLSERWGIDPSLLREQVYRSVPFIDDSEWDNSSWVQTLRDPEVLAWSLPEYFRYCISAHFATVASFLPTDLDPTIRTKLWERASPQEIEEMGKFVLDFLSWDDSKISTRWYESTSGLRISGHQGEWFSIAYPCLSWARRYDLSLCHSMGEAIDDVLSDTRVVLDHIVRSEDYIAYGKTAPLVAHNLGDLNRMIDSLPAWDGASRWRKLINDDSVFQDASRVNTQLTAVENHRHYALRPARSLRASRDLLLPIGPLFDDWGKLVASHPSQSQEDLIILAEHLVDGWELLNKTQEIVGYARALSGLLDKASWIAKQVRRSTQRSLNSGLLRKQISIDQRRFELSWESRIRKILRQERNFFVSDVAASSFSL